jgi:hypothetical protein
MKKYVLIASVTLVFSGYYYSFERGNSTEYIKAEPKAYIKGATPTITKTWETY